MRWRDTLRTFGAEIMVGIDGDDVLCDAWHADRVVERYDETGADYITCVGLPFGTAPTGYSLASLERICDLKSDAEHRRPGPLLRRRADRLAGDGPTAPTPCATRPRG